MNLLKPNFWKDNNIIVFLLWPLTLITKLIIFIKNIKRTYYPKVKTICVGNIYLGGTGKTQLVIKLNEILKKKFKVYVLRKNYKDQIDEQILLRKKTNLVISNKRVEGVKNLEKHKRNIVIFDDGLQDKSISYKIKIVCFNSITGFGNGKLIPAGPLREDLSALNNYDAVFINGKRNNYLISKIKQYNKKIKIFHGRYILKNKNEFKSNYKYLAFCGIGTPENFLGLLRKYKINVQENLIFPDHFNYKINNIKNIKKIALKKKLRIITTEKDYVKVNKFKNFNVKFAKIDLYLNEKNKLKKFLLDNL